jgi:hypothetical protein
MSNQWLCAIPYGYILEKKFIQIIKVAFLMQNKTLQYQCPLKFLTDTACEQAIFG